LLEDFLGKSGPAMNRSSSQSSQVKLHNAFLESAKDEKKLPSLKVSKKEKGKIW